MPHIISSLWFHKQCFWNPWKPLSNGNFWTWVIWATLGNSVLKEWRLSAVAMQSHHYLIFICHGKEWFSLSYKSPAWHFCPKKELGGKLFWTIHHETSCSVRTQPPLQESLTGFKIVILKLDVGIFMEEVSFSILLDPQNNQTQHHSTFVRGFVYMYTYIF